MIESIHAPGYDHAPIELAILTPLPPSMSTLCLAEEVDSEFSNSSEGSTHRNESELAPVDRGMGAWSFVRLIRGLFVALIWGFPNTYGVFLAAYLADSTFSSQQHAASLLPLIGTLATGIMYCSGPLINPLIQHYPSHRRTAMWIGLLISWSSIFGASYSTNVPVLVALQGVIYAIGGSLIYTPCISFLSEWFVVRRGLANGIIFAGAAAGGLIWPLILPTLFAKFGPMKTLRILSIALLVLLAPALPFVKARLPNARVYASRSTRSGAWRNRTLWFVILANTVQGFAYFVPIVWLPTFASALNLSSAQSSLTLSLLNGGSMFGGTVMGILSDKYSPWSLALSTLVCSSVATFVLWGVLSHSLGGVLAFGIAYGSLAGSWSSLWAGFIRPFTTDDPTLSSSILGFLLLSRGVGNVLSTPISTALRHIHSSAVSNYAKTGFEVAGGQYESMIVYTGTCFAGAAVLIGVRWGAETLRK